MHMHARAKPMKGPISVFIIKGILLWLSRREMTWERIFCSQPRFGPLPRSEEWLDRARRSDHCCCCCTSQPLTITILSDSINFLRVQPIHHLRWEHTIFFDLYFRCVLRNILSLTFMPSLFRRSPCRCSSVQTAHTAGIVICGSNK